MNIRIEIDEEELKNIIINDIEKKLGDIPMHRENISIEVKSKQNYKSEWEKAAFRAIYNHYTIPQGD